MKMLEVEARRVYLALLLEPTADEVDELRDCEVTLGMIMADAKERAAAARRCEARALVRETANHKPPLPSMLSDSFFQHMRAAVKSLHDHNPATNSDETFDTFRHTPSSPEDSLKLQFLKERPMPNASTGPLFICKDEDGELCLYGETPPDLDLDKNIALDDVTLWEAYVAASRARQEAAQAVLRGLRKPTITEVKIEEQPVPTRTEIQALARLYVAQQLRACHKIIPAFSALAGVSREQIERAWGHSEPVTPAEPPEMVETLLSKGWLSNVGNGYYTLSNSGNEKLVVAAADGALLETTSQGLTDAEQTMLECGAVASVRDRLGVTHGEAQLLIDRWVGRIRK